MMNFYNISNIRRKDRLLDEQPVYNIIQKGEFWIFSMIGMLKKKSGVYGIVFNYIWDNNNYIYFHCAPEGHIIVCLSKNPLV